MKLLLDTCTFLWIISDDSRLSDKARTVFKHADNEVFLSVVSLWEMTVKYQLGKLPLPATPWEYISRQRELHAVDSLSLKEDDLSHLSSLPDFHKDPFDRALICQAIQGSMALLTPDHSIRQYPLKTIW